MKAMYYKKCPIFLSDVCIETTIYGRLVKLYDDAVQTKTVAIERALIAYLDD